MKGVSSQGLDAKNGDYKVFVIFLCISKEAAEVHDNNIKISIRTIRIYIIVVNIVNEMKDHTVQEAIGKLIYGLLNVVEIEAIFILLKGKNMEWGKEMESYKKSYKGFYKDGQGKNVRISVGVGLPDDYKNGIVDTENGGRSNLYVVYFRQQSNDGMSITIDFLGAGI